MIQYITHQLHQGFSGSLPVACERGSSTECIPRCAVCGTRAGYRKSGRQQKARSVWGAPRRVTYTIHCPKLRASGC